MITGSEMAVVDANAAGLGVPQKQLMESSGNAVARQVKEMVDPGASVTVVCGRGNNGGDAFVAARFLDDYDATVHLLGRPETIATDIARENWAALERAEDDTRVVRDSQGLDLGDPDVVVDAMLGTGVTGALREPERTAAEAIRDADLPVTIVDRTDADGVDVVGDATDPETLRAAGVETARTVLLALPDDTTTEFTTLVVRDLAPNTQILARVEETASIQKMHRAGADYVLSLGRVTGRLSASTVLDDRDVLSLDQQIEVVRSRVPRLVGRTVGEANVREATGCTVIAIERDDETVTDIGPDTRIGADDELIVVGDDEGIREFERRYA